jgi:D-alanyl-D-alanine carboxypeptidase (penicillin-binding protein 5/6)
MNEPDCARSAIAATAVFAFVALICIMSGEIPEKASALVSASPACANIQPVLSLVATAAYAEDLKTGTVLYEKNADAQLPLASLTKLMTTATAMRILSSDDTVTITKEALAPEGDAGFLVDERWKASTLIRYTLLVSANDGAHALALAAAAKEGGTFDDFLRQMNEEARALGMDESFFANDTGLDISSTTAGAYGSARDVATLIASLVRTDPDLIEGTRAESGTFTSLSGYTHEAVNTSDVISTLPGAFASKTGYTDLAGGNLAIVFEPIPGRAVAAVVLGSTVDGRKTDMQALAEGAKRALKRMLLCTDGSESP